MPLHDTDAHAAVAYAHEAGHLKRTTRTGWLLAGVRSPESVAEHSYRVGVLAWLIATYEGAHAAHAATLGLFHDMPETRLGDVPSVGKRYVDTADPAWVAGDQVEHLDPSVGHQIIDLICEHEDAKQPTASLEARCSRDADKLECLLQAREYQREGYTQLDHWITTSAAAMTTTTGKTWAAAALEVSPAAWWETFARNYGPNQ